MSIVLAILGAVLSFTLNVVGKIIAKLSPIILRELVVLTKDAWGLLKTETIAIIENPEVQNDAKLVLAGVKTKLIAAFKATDIRERVALIATPIILVIAIGVYFLHG